MNLIGRYKKIAKKCKKKVTKTAFFGLVFPIPLCCSSRPKFSIVLCAKQELEWKTCHTRDLHATPCWICDRRVELTGLSWTGIWVSWPVRSCDCGCSLPNIQAICIWWKETDCTNTFSVKESSHLGWHVGDTGRLVYQKVPQRGYTKSTRLQHAFLLAASEEWILWLLSSAKRLQMLKIPGCKE